MWMLLLALTVGLPCTLLASAIAYHAHVAARMPSADEGWDPEDEAEPDGEDAWVPPFELAPPASDAALIELQQIVVELQTQLAEQRASLVELLSDRTAVARERAAAPAPVRIVAAVAAGEPSGDLRSDVHRLTAEGLSERAIARRLHVGLEEVRLMAQRQERVS